MPFDSSARKNLAKFVSRARILLLEEFEEQIQEVYGIRPDGSVVPMEKLSHLTDDLRSTAALLREQIEHILSGMPKTEKNPESEAVKRVIREQAFTLFNRFCAIRMAEERDLVQESVGRGFQSKGFQVFEKVAGSDLGGIYERYRTFLFCLFDEISLDLGGLFDRFSPMGMLFPRENALREMFSYMSEEELKPLWSEDETIGWIYQYWNTKEEREKMRKASAAPRNSRELAVRNQFFTPRYVVEFLTDNTLGRIWYEMRKGETVLKDKCRYLVRRPSEIFLEPGVEPPAAEEEDIDLTQEELLKKPAYIEHRDKKDPRDLRILDPACGSGHFLLYAFDLLESIYEEAWEDPGLPASEVTGRRLGDEYETIYTLRLAVPKLIMENNLHGIDIDPRAVQITGLTLWLRAQKGWKTLGVIPLDRPRIVKSNIVTAEPMPGERGMKEEFIAGLKPRVIGQIVEVVFEKMELAGEAGSLTKIDEEIRGAVADARKQWLETSNKEQIFLFSGMDKPKQQKFRFELSGITDESFWEKAEQRVLDYLKQYAERKENGYGRQRRLFADDAARGFAFIDLCAKNYDAVLMNPPFGDPSEITKTYFQSEYNNFSGNILCAFIERQIECMNDKGMAGSVIDRTIFIKNSYEAFRRDILLENQRINGMADLGWGVLDANVEVSCLVFDKNTRGSFMSGANVTTANDKEIDLLRYCKLPEFIPISILLNMPFSAINFGVPRFFFRILKKSKPVGIKYGTFYNGHTIKSDVFKRLYWEVDGSEFSNNWKRMWNGSEYSPYYVSMQEVVVTKKYAGGLANHPSTIMRNPNKHFLSGLCFGKRGEYLDMQILPEGFVLTNEGFGGPFENHQNTWLLLAYVNSRLAQYIVNLYCGQHKGVGYVAELPAFRFEKKMAQNLADLCKDIYVSLQSTNQVEETDPFFRCIINHPDDLDKSLIVLEDGLYDTYMRINSIIERIDKLVYDQAGISDDEKLFVEQETNRRPSHRVLLNYDIKYRGMFFSLAIVSYSLGIAYGRWDVRIGLDPSLAPESIDPFCPLPICPPGMLINRDGLPAKSGEIVSKEWLRARPIAHTLPSRGEVNNPTIADSEYPFRISWDGILVDDPGDFGAKPRDEDIAARVHKALEILWKERAYEIEMEICENLSVESLREYLRKPNSFFEDHLNRYSKGQRQAPIYWPLSTESGEYTLWLYYQRLDDQILFKCVEDFVDPKMEDMQSDIDHLQKEVTQGGSKEKRNRLEKLQDLLLELKDFRDELLRVSKFYKPDLNDGVLINAAPLHRLFRLKKWQKKCKECWDKLEAGEYDWAHMAMNLHPDQIREKCRTDKSLAIAHGLEELYEEPENKKKKRKGKRAKT